MDITLYQIDAFTQKIFSGNPAAVCPLEYWLDDALMQSIAAENNLSETAFIVPDKIGYQIRWYTPVAEVDLCGHATLASSFVIFTYLRPDLAEISFKSKSGMLSVSKKGEKIALNFPANPPIAGELPAQLSEALKTKPDILLVCNDYFVVLENEKQVRNLEPDFALMKELDLQGVIVTAPGEDCDFVSRYFAPKVGINEDPVTGSVHCSLVPYWAKRLKKIELFARQVSARGGELFCRDLGDRTEIAGYACEYLKGTIRF
jgi:PhzF family phenazine biosynthesis protein